MSRLTDRFKNGWNAFVNNKDPSYVLDEDMYYGSFQRPDRVYLTSGIDRTIINAIYNRIALDVCDCDFKHVTIDENGRYTGEVKDSLNNVLTLSANTDQTARAFMQDVVMSMFDEGCVAILPVETDTDPEDTEAFKIYTMRTGKIVDWYPTKVKIHAFDERVGKYKDTICDKSYVGIIENPFYATMNSPNSTLKRLVRKINLLDKVDENNSSGKLDLIIQLPYTIKTETRRNQAEMRRKDIEAQLVGSKYGIAYTDGTEKITQLNRPVENTLVQQIDSLTSMLYSQLGLTQDIMNGTASEEAMINYYSRTVEPILSAITDEMNRKFISKTARTQGHRIMYFRDPFKLTSVTNIASIADTFTRNEIMSSNEIRAIIGMKPSNQPGADELRNKNLNQSSNGGGNNPTGKENDYKDLRVRDYYDENY